MAHAAETSTHRITLDFEDAETLEHIGDRDAPVMITGGTVTAGGPTYQLWAGYTPALRALEARDHETTASDLIRAVREEAAADPDRVYEGPSQTTCEYADANGNPLCLNGHALARPHSTRTTRVGLSGSRSSPPSCSHIESIIGWRRSCPSWRVMVRMVWIESRRSVSATP